jgi:adenosylmethionine-8-amino-7-oxononanoate aminotransferase
VEECERALAHLEQVILLEGPSTISALVLESVIGSSGVIVPPAGYLRGVRDLCTRHDIVYIADEVLVGFGRTGAWFGVDHESVSPDLLVFAKGVNSGYVPLGGVLVGNPIFETFTKRPYPAGIIYRGTRSLARPLWAPSAQCTTRAPSPQPPASVRRSSARDSPSSRRSIPVWAMFVASGGCGPSNSSATG